MSTHLDVAYDDDLLAEERKRIKEALADSAYANLNPMPHRLLTTLPMIPGARHQRLLPGSTLYAPGVDDRARSTWGLCAVVLKAGADCHPWLVQGIRVLIPEHCGDIICEDDRQTAILLIGDGDVMAVLEGQWATPRSKAS